MKKIFSSLLICALILNPVVFAGDTATNPMQGGGGQMTTEEEMTEVFGPLFGFDHEGVNEPPQGPPQPPGPFDQFAREVVVELIKILKAQQKAEEERRAAEERERIEKAAQEMIDAINRAMRDVLRSFSGGPSDFGDGVGVASAGGNAVGRDLLMAGDQNQQQDEHQHVEHDNR